MKKLPIPEIVTHQEPRPTTGKWLKWLLIATILIFIAYAYQQNKKDTRYDEQPG